MPKFVFGPHYGGISEDDSLVRQGQILYAENMDLTSNSQFITNSRKPTNFRSTADEIVSGFNVNIGEYNFMLFCDDSNNLYRDAEVTPVWTAEQVQAYWTTSTDLFMMDAAEDIHKISLANAKNQASYVGFVTTVDTSIPTSTQSFYNVIPGEAKTFVAVNTDIYEVDNTATSNAVIATFDFSNDDIVGMTRVGTTIKVYTSSGSLMLWDGVDTTFSERIELGVNISFVKQIANIDYIISSGVLYFMNGYTLTPVITSYFSDVLNSDKIRISRNKGLMTLTSLKSVFYIAGEGVVNLLGDGEQFGRDSVLTFGQKLSTLPPALNTFLTEPATGSYIQKTHGVFVQSNPNAAFNDVLYVAYKDDLNANGIMSYGIANGSYTVANKGVVVYEVFNGNVPQQKKKLTELKVRADIPDTANQRMKFYYINRTATGDNMVKIKTTNTANTDGIYTFKTNLDFYDLTLCIVFENDGNVTTKRDALKYYNVTISYDNIGK